MMEEESLWKYNLVRIQLLFCFPKYFNHEEDIPKQTDSCFHLAFIFHPIVA